MARGWESKSVEDQQAEAASPLDKSKPQLTPDQLAKKRESDGLILTRKRVDEFTFEVQQRVARIPRWEF